MENRSKTSLYLFMVRLYSRHEVSAFTETLSLVQPVTKHNSNRDLKKKTFNYLQSLLTYLLSVKLIELIIFTHVIGGNEMSMYTAFKDVPRLRTMY